uniref:Uncharacterized protein n=1 Tax=Anguilla anguilla TaxID=7936 RepID=A0A0E9PF96_ANGAN
MNMRGFQRDLPNTDSSVPAKLHVPIGHRPSDTVFWPGRWKVSCKYILLFQTNIT